MRKQVLTASLVIAAIAPDVLVAGQNEAKNIRPSLVETISCKLVLFAREDCENALTQ